MAKSSPIQSSFAGGEYSPLIYGRVDAERYRIGLKTCLNYLPTLQGPLVRRPGSKVIEEVKTSADEALLIPFVFSRTQAYVIEAGDTYFRFYRNNGQLQSNSNAVEVSTPYADEELTDLRYFQSADVLYLLHPSYSPRKLTRVSDTSWTLAEVDFQDGPYLPLNSEATTLTSSATSGNTTVTASSTTGINGGDGFQSTDVGRHIRMKIGSGGEWVWLKITAHTNTTSVTATIQDGATGVSTAATTNWRLGLWSATTGYPTSGTFHEDRMVLFSNLTVDPQRIDMSVTGDYEYFAPTDTDADATVLDDSAVSRNLNAEDVNEIQWGSSQERGLVVGTVGGEWLITPSFESIKITPANIKGVRVTTFGSISHIPARPGKGTMFIQRSGRKVREVAYDFEEDGLRTPDRSILAEHLVANGVDQLAFQRDPTPIVWARRQDGVLLSLTYESEGDNLVAGWARHELAGAGVGAAASVRTGKAKVVAITVIPSPDGTRDELWMVVERSINGATKKHIEYFGKFFDELDEQHDAFFVDSGLTQDDPKTVSGVTAANPPVVTTSAAHGFSDGDTVRFNNIAGMTELNDQDFTVANKTNTTFELSGIDGTGYTAFENDGLGEVRKLNQTFSGLGHLEGESVSILADGAVHPNETVSSGSITLDYPAAVVHIGLGYNSDGQMLRNESGAQDGTALGKTRRIHRMGILFHRSLGLQIGMAFSDLTTMTFRSANDDMSRAVPLFSGIKSELVKSTHDFANEFCWRQSQPLPSTILALAPQMKTEDRG